MNEILKQGSYFLSSKVPMRFVKKVEYNDGMDHYRLTPQQIKDIKQDRGSNALIAVHLDEPMHAGHIMNIEKTRNDLLEQGYENPQVLLHLQDDPWCYEDLPYRMNQAQAMLDDSSFNRDYVTLALWPSKRLKTGPFEALWQVSSRVHAGVTHMLIDTWSEGSSGNTVNVDEKKGGQMYEQQIIWHLLKMANLCHIIELRAVGLEKNELTFDYIGTQDAMGMTPADSVERVKRSKYDKLLTQRIYDLAQRVTRPKGIMSEAAWTAIAAQFK